MNLLKAFTTISGFTLLSRILGFIRDMLMARSLGAGVIADAFLVAFKLPNLLRRLFAEGAFSAAFIPLFNQCLNDSKQTAQLFAGRALLWLSSVLICLLVLAQIFMPQVILVLAPGFHDDLARLPLAIALGHLTFPYLLTISLVALFTGILNSINRYSYGAAAPILLNILMIGALLAPVAGIQQAMWLAIAVSVSGLLQLSYLVYGAYKHSVMPLIRQPFITDNTKKLLKLMLPAMLGAGVYQLNIMIDIFFASLLPAGSVSWLYYADRLAQLPLGVIGVALGSALLPVLSRKLQAGDKTGALGVQQQAIQVCLFFALPCMVGLLILAQPILTVLFERGEFTAVDSQQTARALQIFALALPATLLSKIFLSTCFALQDTKTPVKIAVVALVINIVLNILLWREYQHVGIAIATAVSTWVSLILVILYLGKRDALAICSPALCRGLEKNMALAETTAPANNSGALSSTRPRYKTGEQVWGYFTKVLLATVALTVVLVLFPLENTALSLLLCIGLAGLVYIGLCYLTGVFNLKMLNRL